MYICMFIPATFMLTGLYILKKQNIHGTCYQDSKIFTCMCIVQGLNLQSSLFQKLVLSDILKEILALLKGKVSRDVRPFLLKMGPIRTD